MIAIKEGRLLRVSMVAIVLLSSLLMRYAWAMPAPQPMVVTGLLVLVSVFVVVPNNVLYPRVLAMIPGSRRRAAAASNAIKLLATAALVWLFAHHHDHGLSMVATWLWMSYSVALLVYRIGVHPRRRDHCMVEGDGDEAN